MGLVFSTEKRFHGELLYRKRMQSPNVLCKSMILHTSMLASQTTRSHPVQCQPVNASTPNRSMLYPEINRHIYLIAPQHTVHEVSQGTPKVLSAGKVVLVNEEDILLKAGIEMWLQS